MDDVITLYELLAPSWIRGQLDVLRFMNPDWVIRVDGFGSDWWLEASRPNYTGTGGGCSLVRRDVPAMRCALCEAVIAELPAAETVASI